MFIFKRLKSFNSQKHSHWFCECGLFLDEVWVSKGNVRCPYLTPPSQPSSWQFSSVGREPSGVSEALRCEWRTCGTKSVTLRRQCTRIGMNRRCSGLRPLAGAKQNVCNNKECIASWKTVCLWLQGCVWMCVCQRQRKQRVILLPTLMWARMCVCVCARASKRACSLVNMYAVFITKLQSFNHSYWVTKDVPCSHNQTRFLNKVLFWGTSKLQQKRGP